jgi:hypothetical protein
MKILILVLISFSLYASNPSSKWTEIVNIDQISVLGQENKSGVIPFKAIGIIDANIDEVLSALKDHKNKSKWSPKLKSVKIHKRMNDNEYIFSEFYSTPWPASDREFLLKAKISKISPNKYIIAAHSIDDLNFKNDDHIQADVKYLNIFLEEKSANQTTLEFEFHGDLKGWMPVWLINLVQKKWPMRFIQGLRSHIALKKNKAHVKLIARQ